MNRSILFISVVVSSGCGASVDAMTGLPIAAITCPASGAVGVPFTIDPSSSSDDEGAFALVDLDVNGDKRSELSPQTFTVDYPGVVVAALKVTDLKQNVATATCRFLVEGDAVEEDPIEDPIEDPVEDPVEEDPVEDPIEDPVVAPENLTGSFAMVAYDNPKLAGGGLDPELQCTPSPALALVDLVEGEGELTMTLTWCHLELPDVAIGLLGVQDTEIPDSTTQLLGSLGPATFPFDGSNFAPPLDVFNTVVAGATNLEGPLPDNDNAPNVSNPDGDENQGVPIFTSTFIELQLNVAVRRTIMALSGSVVSTSEIDGSTTGSFQVNTEVGMLNGGATSIAQPETSTPMPSRFKMTRIDDGATCADVIARQSSLIASLPAPPTTNGCHVPQQR